MRASRSPSRARAWRAPALLFVLCACGATRPPAVPADSFDPLPWGAVAREGRAPLRRLGGLAAHDASRLSDADGDGRLEYDVLALSSGGSYGAFGAGFLAGWAESGARPRFQVVTGISSGALMATWAFLGPEHDDALRVAFTELEEQDLFERRWVFAALYAAAITDTARLRQRLEEQITAELLDAVATEHAAGRRLFVGTTYLDREAFVVWDLGAIAASGRADRVARYRDVLMAAAAIPALFPPVYFDVEIDGERYAQMHVDSGHDTVFLRPYLLHPEAFEGELDVRLHVLLSHALDGHGAHEVKPRVFRIATSQSQTLVSSLHRSSVTRIYLLAVAQGFGYALANIPPRTAIAFPEFEFELDGMRALYELGRCAGLDPGSWSESPPHLEPEELPPVRTVERDDERR